MARVSRARRVAMASTPNSPNPAKFLKEMETLIPALQRSGHIPTNREEARALGEKNVRMMTAREAKDQAAEALRRQSLLGIWFDQHMKEQCPWVYSLVSKTQLPIIFNLCGYTMSADHGVESVQGVPNIPVTICKIKRFGFMKYGERIVWEEPVQPEQPKSRIILP